MHETVNPELAARRTAAAGVLADYDRDDYLPRRPTERTSLAMRLASELRSLLEQLQAETPAPGPNTAPTEAAKLAAIREVLARFDWETGDRQIALERIDEIAGATGTRTGPELSGGAYISPADLGTVLDALDVAADYNRNRAANCPDCDAGPADLCTTGEHRLSVADGYDNLARRLGADQ